jgi:hypothetical protein
MKTYTVVITIKEGVQLFPPTDNDKDLQHSFIVGAGEDPHDWNEEVSAMLDAMKD